MSMIKDHIYPTSIRIEKNKIYVWQIVWMITQSVCHSSVSELIEIGTFRQMASNEVGVIANMYSLVDKV